MLKGHAKLVLIDRRGNVLEEIEKDNMITNALDFVIPTLIGSNKSPNEYLLPIAFNALGGLMLFDGPLEEDADNIHFPNKDVHLVGYGGRYTDAGNPQRGSYNSSESSSNENSYTMVWDFNTSQANGTIRSLALTHRLGGECPFGFFNTNINVGDLRTSDGDKYIFHRDQKTQLEYYFMGAGSGGAPIRSVFNPSNIFGVADGAASPKRYSSIIKTLPYYGIQHHYLYNAGSYSNPRWETRYANVQTGNLYRDGFDGYHYVVWSPGNSSGDGTFYLKKLKTSDVSFEEDEQQTEVTCANCQFSGPNSDGTHGGNTGASGYGVVSNGFVYLRSYDRHKVYKIELANTLNIVEINIGSAFTIYSDGTFMFPVRSGGCRVIAQENKGDGNYHAHHFLISEDGAYTMDQIDRNYSTWYHSYYEGWTETPDLKVLTRNNYGYLGRKYLAFNYLGTICNLSSPVIKTAAASLKVIYTLTDEPEPEPEEEEPIEEPTEG